MADKAKRQAQRPLSRRPRVRHNVTAAIGTDICGGRFPPGAVLPKHKHPFPRYGYVQAGTIEVTNLDIGKTETFKTGDFIVEAVDQWHFGANKGADPVKLLVIDMVEKGAVNTVLQK